MHNLPLSLLVMMAIQPHLLTELMYTHHFILLQLLVKKYWNHSNIYHQSELELLMGSLPCFWNQFQMQLLFLLLFCLNILYPLVCLENCLCIIFKKGILSHLWWISQTSIAMEHIISDSVFDFLNINWFHQSNLGLCLNGQLAPYTVV